MIKDLIQVAISGIAVGSTYSMIALGFVLIYSATHLLNFAQGAAVLLGAYLTYQLGSVWHVPFVVAVLASTACCSLVSIALERVIIRRIPDENHFAAVMITVGALFAVQALIDAVWGSDPLSLGDPWGVRTVDIGGVAVSLAALWTIGISWILLVAFFLVLTYSRTGLAIRTSVSDPLAATAHGVSLGRVKILVWGMAGAAGGIAGVLMATGSDGVTTSLGVSAFSALPAMVLGGLDSPVGAIAGGLIIGVVQQFAAYYESTHMPSLGSGFAAVTPYIILVIVLPLRPAGLFGVRNAYRF
jgi:branched-chain amino acid transport system permease protein